MYFIMIFNFIHFYENVYFLNMCLNFSGLHQIEIKSLQQNRVTTRNHG